VTAFPATILVNKRGFVYTSMIGYFEEYDTWLTNNINWLLQ
jgi:hypothetical protein